MALEIRSIIWPQLWAINSMLKDYKTVLQTTYILDHAPLVTSLHSIPMPTDNGTAKQTIDGVGHTPSVTPCPHAHRQWNIQTDYRWGWSCTLSGTLPPCPQTMEQSNCPIDGDNHVPQ